MAPLTHALVGLILEAFAFGTHLDGSGNTIDTELEEKNFHAAAEILSEVWSKTFINGFKVDSKAVGQECHYEPEDELDQLWVSNHVIQTRYMVMIVKCQIESCCKPFVTNWMDIFPMRFLPGNNILFFTLVIAN